MPALDPFSASARPMIAFDTQASRPLPFAATLHDRDINTPNGARTTSDTTRDGPWGKKVNFKLSGTLTPDQYAHERGKSFDLKDIQGNLPVDPARVKGGDEWMQAKIARCLENAQHNLDISGRSLETLSTKIEDLGNIVILPSSSSPRLSNSSSFNRSPSGSPFPPSPNLPQFHEPNSEPRTDHFAANSRSLFSRTTSAPVSFGTSPLSLQQAPSANGNTHAPSFPVINEEADQGLGFGLAPHANGARRFGRSKTGAANLGREVQQEIRGRMDIELHAANNLFTSLPSALFHLTNLTYLTLRANRLTELPAGIGALSNLKELNIANNHLTFLPSTILDLVRLERISLYPNDFHKLPPNIEESTTINDDIAIPQHQHHDSTTPTSYHTITPSGRKLGPLIRHSKSSVPKLTSILANYLISPRGSDNKPPLLDIDWRVEERGEVHPLLDAAALHRRIPSISEKQLQRVLQALKSASKAASQNLNSSHHHRHGFQAVDIKPDPFPTSHRTPPPDDASKNPYFYPCPSPRHKEFDDDSIVDRPSRHLFLDAAEERLEWREFKGEKDVPIRWLGCSPGCLTFLEAEPEEDELWGLEEEDE